MTRPHAGQRLLRLTLILGGLPPLLSGLAAALAPETFVQTLGGGAPAAFSEASFTFVVFLANLQGGDAFIAGFSRIAVAFLGGVGLLRLFAVAGIAHSLFELWRLPGRLLDWAAHAPAEAVSPLLHTEVWAFMSFHTVLAIGFALGLIQSFSRHWVYGGGTRID